MPERGQRRFERGMYESEGGAGAQERYISREELEDAYEAAREEAMQLKRLLDEADDTAPHRGGRRHFAEQAQGPQQPLMEDPLEFMAFLVDRARAEILDEVDRMIDETMTRQRHIDRSIEAFVRQPGNEHLQPYEEEIEHMMVDKQMTIAEAAATVESIVRRKGEEGIRRKAVQARTRAMGSVESASDISGATEERDDLEKRIGRAKTVKELFNIFEKS